MTVERDARGSRRSLRDEFARTAAECVQPATAGYAIGWHSNDDGCCHVSLDGDDLFDVTLYEDASGASLAALRRIVALARAALPLEKVAEPPNTTERARLVERIDHAIADARENRGDWLAELEDIATELRSVPAERQK